MIDLIKKTMFTGIGFAALTKEKIEEIAQEFVDRGKLSEQEGQKIIQEMIDKSEESKEELKKQIDKTIGTTLEKMQLARASELEDLRTEVTLLKKKIESFADGK
jgi:polyhydroxyalkanoate synthesis regulator phasin